MDKLTLNDIKIKSPGKQVKEIVIDQFEDLDNFASAIEMETRTLTQYLKERKLGSDTFKIRLSMVLGKGLDEIVKSEKTQVKEIVQSIYDNIRLYKTEEDLTILTKAKELCVKNSLYLDIAKMQRNIAMYYFYRNQIDKATGLIESALDAVKDHNYLIKWKSELGLMYFYKREYKKSRKLYEEVDKLLSASNEADEKTMYLHYYRYGILQNNTNHPSLAERLFEKSLEYADTNIDKGDSIMNIGLCFKKQKKYKRAMEYYRKALDFCDEDLSKSTLFNNLAEIYRALEEYDKALYYVKLALSCVNDENLSDLFIYSQTHVQILMSTGKVGEAIDQLMELINKAEDKFVYKKFIIDGINIIIEYGRKMKNIDILEDMDELIFKLIKGTTSDNIEYMQELKTCLGDIRFYVKSIERQLQSKGGI